MSVALLRRGVGRITTAAQRDLASKWKQGSDAAAARDALMEILPGLVDRYGLAAAAFAADWYDALREQRSVRGRFVAEPADLGDTRTEQLARVAAGPLFAAEPDWKSALVLAQGGLQRRVANGARQTVMQSSIRDPQARGWQRVGDGSSCEFCAMLLGRGAVYTEATADFPAHDHCGCGAEPAF